MMNNILSNRAILLAALLAFAVTLGVVIGGRIADTAAGTVALGVAVGVVSGTLIALILPARRAAPSTLPEGMTALALTDEEAALLFDLLRQGRGQPSGGGKARPASRPSPSDRDFSVVGGASLADDYPEE
jgi:hypothetical protein